MPDNNVETLNEIVSGQKQLANALGLTKDQIDAIAVVGFNLYEQGKTQEAETIFRGLTALDENLHYGYAGLGALALAAEPPQLDEAYRLLTKAAELSPSDPTIHANLGETLLRQGKFDEAAKEFEKSLGLDPDEEDAGANRARAIIDGMEVVINELERVGAKV